MSLESLSDRILSLIVKYNPEVFTKLNKRFASLCERYPVILRLDPDETLTYMKTYVKGRTYVHRNFNLIGDTLWCDTNREFLSDLIKIVHPRVCHVFRAYRLEHIDTIYHYGDLSSPFGNECNIFVAMSAVTEDSISRFLARNKCNTLYIAKLFTDAILPDVHYKLNCNEDHYRTYFAVNSEYHIRDNIYLVPVRQYIMGDLLYLNNTLILDLSSLASSDYIVSNSLKQVNMSKVVDLQPPYPVISVKDIAKRYPEMLVTFLKPYCDITDVEYPFIVTLDTMTERMVITRYGYLYRFHNIFID